MSKSFGMVKLQLASEKSYVLAASEDRWPLLIMCTKGQSIHHQNIMKKIFRYICENKSSKTKLAEQIRPKPLTKTTEQKQTTTQNEK